MSSSLRWGLSLALSGDLSEPAFVAEVAAQAEDAGWDGVFVWDHLWNRTAAPFADPWVTLAAIAIATERVRIGTMVTPLPRRRPQVVAQHAATLDRLSEGRLTLSLGLGVDSYGEYSAFGEPLTDDRARAVELDRGIELLLPALAGDPVPAAGNRRTTVAARQQPRCPIWVAGRPGKLAGPRRALRHGLDGVALVGAEVWTVGDVTSTLDVAGPGIDALDLVLVGGEHPDPDALAEAGATWALVEVMPDTPGPDVRDLARRTPGA